MVPTTSVSVIDTPLGRLEINVTATVKDLQHSAGETSETLDGARPVVKVVDGVSVEYIDDIPVYDGKMKTWVAATREVTTGWYLPGKLRGRVQRGEMMVIDTRLWAAVKIEQAWDRCKTYRGAWEKASAASWNKVAQNPTQDMRRKVAAANKCIDRMEAAVANGDAIDGPKSIDDWFAIFGPNLPWPGAYELLYEVVEPVLKSTCDTRSVSQGPPSKMPRGVGMPPSPEGKML